MDGQEKVGKERRKGDGGEGRGGEGKNRNKREKNPAGHAGLMIRVSPEPKITANPRLCT